MANCGHLYRNVDKIDWSLISTDTFYCKILRRYFDVMIFR